MKKTIIVLVLLAILILPTTLTSAQSSTQTKDTSPMKFTDLSGHWAEAAVQKLAEKSAIPFDGDKFIPGKAITRSEFAVMLHKALNISIEYFKAPDIKDYFTDVKQDAPYASALIDLVTASIIEGKGSFKPDASFTREEMVHYIMNAYKYKMGDKYKMIKIKPSSFKDNDKINPSYSGDVARAADLKLIQGIGNNIFSPAGKATRAQAAVVIARLLDLLDKENPQVVVQPSAMLKGGSLEMKLTIINNSNMPVTIEHTSGQKYDFILLDSDKNILYTWSADKSFIMELTRTVIEAGKSIEFVEVLNKETYSSIKDKAMYLKAYMVCSLDSFNINPEGYEIKINY